MKNCHDCEAAPGEQHLDACDVARCMNCGGQYISCGCPEDELLHIPDIWTGEWPGLADCRRFDLWCVRNPDGPGYVPVPKDTPGASEDLNRLGPPEFRWNRAGQYWEKTE